MAAFFWGGDQKHFNESVGGQLKTWWGKYSLHDFWLALLLWKTKVTITKTKFLSFYKSLQQATLNMKINNKYKHNEQIFIYRYIVVNMTKNLSCFVDNIFYYKCDLSSPFLGKWDWKYHESKVQELITLKFAAIDSNIAVTFGERISIVTIYIKFCINQCKCKIYYSLFYAWSWLIKSKTKLRYHCQLKSESVSVSK